MYAGRTAIPGEMSETDRIQNQRSCLSAIDQSIKALAILKCLNGAFMVGNWDL